jgi:hypothetical protein
MVAMRMAEATADLIINWSRDGSLKITNPA